MESYFYTRLMQSWTIALVLLLCLMVSVQIGAQEEQTVPRPTPAIKKVSMPEIEVTAPAIVAPDEPFLIMYRTNPVAPVRLRPQADIETMGDMRRKSTIELESDVASGSWGRRMLALKTPGDYGITLTFSRQSETVKKTLNVKVLSSAEQERISGARAWELPDKAIYLSDTAGKWSEAPEEKREQIRLERRHFAILKPQPQGDNEWWPIQAWNELSSVLQVEWLPERSLIKTFENNARPTRDRVAYAAYIKNNHRIIFKSEIGKQSWIYVEQSLNAAESENQLADMFTERLLIEPGDPKNATLALSASLISRTFTRYRALKPDSPTEPVLVHLIHVCQPAQLMLKLPGF